MQFRRDVGTGTKGERGDTGIPGHPYRSIRMTGTIGAIRGIGGVTRTMIAGGVMSEATWIVRVQTRPDLTAKEAGTGGGTGMNRHDGDETTVPVETTMTGVTIIGYRHHGTIRTAMATASTTATVTDTAMVINTDRTSNPI